MSPDTDCNVRSRIMVVQKEEGGHAQDHTTNKWQNLDSNPGSTVYALSHVPSSPMERNSNLLI